MGPDRLRIPLASPTWGKDIACVQIRAREIDPEAKDGRGRWLEGVYNFPGPGALAA
jgi:hypothetical protein